MAAGAARTPLSSWILAATVVGLAVALLIMWLLWTTGNDDTASSPDRVANGAGEGHATNRDDTDDCPWHTETLVVGGMTVPADCDHGPAEVSDDGRLAEWAQTPEGAAHAAAGLRIATGALVGPDVYRATVEEQTYGPDSERAVYLDDVEQDYAELDQQHQLDGGPFEGTWPRGQIQGYRVEEYADDETTVWLLTSAADQQVAYRMDLQWARDDWHASVEILRRWRDHMDRNPLPERFEEFS